MSTHLLDSNNTVPRQFENSYISAGTVTENYGKYDIKGMRVRSNASDSMQ
jgi:hypothetical protein